MENGQWGYEFWLREDVFPGTVSRCLFHLSIENVPEYWDEEERNQVKIQLGYLPPQSIEVSSGCNQREDHVTLGQFVLHLAQTYKGLIDMMGAITPPVQSSYRTVNMLPSPTTSSDIDALEQPLPEISRYVQAMPGTVYEIEYTIPSGRRCVFHIVDRTFFQSWLQNPHFHMIK